MRTPSMNKLFLGLINQSLRSRCSIDSLKKFKVISYTDLSGFILNKETYANKVKRFSTIRLNSGVSLKPGMMIRPSHPRKFFEQMCNNVLMIHPGT
ncbi:MAG: hypothetical protein PWR09_1064 [Archaeoglobi archaeon]|nr:hypothetical protein [Archaeoglobi archaeon]